MKQLDDCLYRRIFPITVWDVPVVQNCNAINTMYSGSKFFVTAVFRFGKIYVTSAREYNNYDRKIQSTAIQFKIRIKIVYLITHFCW